MGESTALQVRCTAILGSLSLDVSFETDAAWTVLFGPSGSGKSSLLRLVAGLWRPSNAVVLFRGEDVSHMPAHRRRIGLVAQKPALFPHLDVLGNILFGRMGTAETQATVGTILDLFNLGVLQHAPVQRLSGGEYQRVALARALAAHPRLLLLDEVFTGMHLEQRSSLLQRLRTYCSSVGLPVLAVTHDVSEACAVSDEVVRLEEGRVIAQGKADQVLAAERDAVRRALTALPVSA